MQEDKVFIDSLLSKHQLTPEVPSSRDVSNWAFKLMEVLFPEISEKRLNTIQKIENALHLLKIELEAILLRTKACHQEKNKRIAQDFFEHIPFIHKRLLMDIEAFVSGDPAAWSSFEVVRSYPGFFAIYIYRIAHQLCILDVPFIPRILSEFAHSKTGIDIHPSAIIGDSFFIDHGTGVVIGETCNIGNYVKLYQGVTLGALSIDKAKAGVKRHPTVEDHVIIYSGATILGGDSIIGEGSIIGGNVWLTTSVAPFTKVYHNSNNKYIENLNPKSNG